ncbi:hypothetical protein [Pedobacter xixiisoli]|uniref:Uncharacterized protein n=1 Tax=Pedobacter xixiisoli TaxID=1476464 RepID=A0A286A6F0_9SPHI|nr:hypothetical protein [Pedobacter xixiisoli]SOD17494.1 hypothetical protein SAMN06297358_2554 [Pedobacter xixiisoli]
MKLLVKSSFTIFLLLLFVNISYAQKVKRAPYNALVYIAGNMKVHGKITAINDTALVLVDKKDVTHAIAYQKIERIKVFKRHGDVGYAVATGALIAGSIVASQSIDDGATAMLVGIAGTATVAGLSIALHNVLHGAELKINASKEKIDYQNLSQKLGKYIVNDIALKP